MEDKTSWTPSPDENIQGITDKNIINELESRGIATAELWILNLDVEVTVTIGLILDIHKLAFSDLYDWAGKWRNVEVVVGQLTPPSPVQLPQLMYQFVDHLNYKFYKATSLEDKLDCLVYVHYEFVKIHPFNNGNGRTGRLLMNLIALKLGFHPIELYHQSGEKRSTYIKAMKEADDGNFKLLRSLIAEEISTL